MKKFLTILAVAGVVLAVAGTATAIPFSPGVTGVDGTPTANDSGPTGYPQLYQAVNYLLGGTPYASNTDIDPLFVEPDYVWEQLDGTVVLIGLSAGNQNTLGVYTGLGSGSGTTAVLGPYSGLGLMDPHPIATIGLGTGTLFGWYLQSNDAYWYSEPDLNPNGYDHMMTFDLSGANGTVIDTTDGTYTLNDAYLIGWEDLAWDGDSCGDDDYNDMIYILGSVQPIPEPATMLILGGLGAGLASARKLRRKK